MFLVWEYVAGETLEAYLTAKSDRAGAVLRQVSNHVRRLHMLGIVHGALHERNVIVGSEGGVQEMVKLTHISPLLYTEQEVDLAALEGMRKRWGVVESAATERPAMERETGRWVVLVAAGLVTALGGMIAWGIWTIVKDQ